MTDKPTGEREEDKASDPFRSEGDEGAADPRVNSTRLRGTPPEVTDPVLAARSLADTFDFLAGELERDLHDPSPEAAIRYERIALWVSKIQAVCDGEEPRVRTMGLLIAAIADAAKLRSEGQGIDVCASDVHEALRSHALFALRARLGGPEGRALLDAAIEAWAQKVASEASTKWPPTRALLDFLFPGEVPKELERVWRKWKVKRPLMNG